MNRLVHAAFVCPVRLCLSEALAALRLRKRGQVFQEGCLVLDGTGVRAVNASFVGYLALVSRRHARTTGRRPVIVCLVTPENATLVVGLRKFHLHQVADIQVACCSEFPDRETWTRLEGVSIRQGCATWQMRAFIGELMRLHPQNRRNYLEVWRHLWPQ